MVVRGLRRGRAPLPTVGEDALLVLLRLRFVVVRRARRHVGRPVTATAGWVPLADDCAYAASLGLATRGWVLFGDGGECGPTRPPTDCQVGGV